MKYGKCFVLCATVLSLLPFAFAKDKDHVNISFSESVVIGKTQLKPGDYQLKWSGSGDKVQVTVLEGGKTVATTEAKLVENPQPSPYDSVSVTTLPDNTQTIQEVDFAHSKEALVFTSTSSTQAAGQ
jgi:hypothetical protein